MPGITIFGAAGFSPPLPPFALRSAVKDAGVELRQPVLAEEL
jgi:hypothetical protein